MSMAVDYSGAVKQAAAKVRLRQFAERISADPVVFSRDRLGIIPDPWQAQVLRSTSKQMLLNCSRQAGKSTTAATLALHTAKNQPASLTILVSPSLRQSSELFRKVADLVDRMKLPPTLIEDNKLSMTLANRSRIVSLPGSEGTIRGYSAVDLIIGDEASRIDDALFYAVRPMLAVSGGRLILMSTPFGKRGVFYEMWENGGDTWERFKVTAYDVPRITDEFLAEERKTMGPMWFASEYLCEFTETVDAVFRHDDVMGALTPSVTPLFGGAL